MKKLVTIVFAFSMLIGITFFGDAVGSNGPLSVAAQTVRGKHRRRNFARRTTHRALKGGRMVGRKTWHGTKRVGRKTLHGTKMVGRKTWHGTKRVGHKIRRVF